MIVFENCSSFEISVTNGNLSTFLDTRKMLSIHATKSIRFDIKCQDKLQIHVNPRQTQSESSESDKSLCLCRAEDIYVQSMYRAGLSIGHKVLKVMFLGVPPACLGSR